MYARFVATLCQNDFKNKFILNQLVTIFIMFLTSISRSQFLQSLTEKEVIIVKFDILTDLLGEKSL